MDGKTKQQKRVNYTKEEKSDLLAILKKYPMNYNKTTSNKGINVKREAWKNVTTEFNNIEGHTIARTEDQLKKLWENTKTDYKKNLTVQKRETYATGGGVITCTFAEDPNVELLLNSVECEIRSTMDSDYFDLLKSTSVAVDESATIPILSQNDGQIPSSSGAPISHATESVELVEEEEFVQPMRTIARESNAVTPFARRRNSSHTCVNNDVLEEEEIRNLENEIFEERNDGNTEENADTTPLVVKRPVSENSKRSKTREAVNEELLRERKRLMNIEHKWKKDEYEMRKKQLLDEHQLKKDVLLAKKEAMTAKKLYYECMTNKRRTLLPYNRRTFILSVQFN